MRIGAFRSRLVAFASGIVAFGLVHAAPAEASHSHTYIKVNAAWYGGTSFHRFGYRDVGALFEIPMDSPPRIARTKYGLDTICDWQAVHLSIYPGGGGGFKHVSSYHSGCFLYQQFADIHTAAGFAYPNGMFFGAYWADSDTNGLKTVSTGNFSF